MLHLWMLLFTPRNTDIFIKGHHIMCTGHASPGVCLCVCMGRGSAPPTAIATHHPREVISVVQYTCTIIIRNIQTIVVLHFKVPIFHCKVPILLYYYIT